ncbi:MAG: phosphoribosylglycinamide formyltransferase [Bacteroidales bacterium]|nr:phosphoribosylglycinamide formyltransferase [Bacteroidales bacterium]
MSKRIVILASGSGTNAEAIARYFEPGANAKVTLIMSNRCDAYVLERAKKLNIPANCFSRTELYETDLVLNRLKAENPSLIVLAGFLWLMPDNIIRNFTRQIINIHPALLPKYGGRGMYGSKVHEAVIAAAEKESGISIHYVNEKYDEGDIIFQARCPVLPNDTPETLAQRIHALEHRHYPEVIEKLLASL